MSYFRKTPKLIDGLDLLNHEQKWLILINADPDAMASAMALKRIIGQRVDKVSIAHINTIKRPDNLAMIRYAKIPMRLFKPSSLKKYTHFAMVDSQPSHSPMFADIKFSIIIDHHPVVTEPGTALYQEIHPDYGATSTLMTEYLYNLGIRPGQMLATALQFGIKTDTANFQRNVNEIDLRAYLYLNKFANQAILSRIVHNEFHIDWLPYFARACTNMHKAGSGYFIYIGEIPNPDTLVVIADFFTRIYEVRWLTVAGYHDSTVVIIFRGDGNQDLGKLAAKKFASIGSAGGHKTMARAEFSISVLNGEELELFIYKKLIEDIKKPQTKNPVANS